jgi:phage tail tape-measure protein
MMPLTTPPTNTASVDADLAEQARPGHGVPSQDPNPGAQFAMAPQDADREAKSVLVGGGVIAGAAAGAALGVMVAGPVGVVVGSTLGAVAGAVGGGAAGALANPTDSGGADTDLAETVPQSLEVDHGRSRREPILPLVDPGR